MSRKDIAFAILLLTVPLHFGFMEKGYNKATKKDELIVISTEAEKRMGASIAKQVEKKYKDTDDPLVQKHIEEIGCRIAETCERKDVIYRFKVLKAEKEDDYNAFALPGGYVYIFDALINVMKDDDEIAAILAHEVGHIAAKHSIKRLQSSMGANALMLLGMGMRADSRELVKADYAVNQLMMAYSREAEREADQLSVRYLKNAGFDPNGVVESLEMLKHLRKKGPIRAYTYFRTHPYLSERLANAKSEIKECGDFESYINVTEEDDSF